MGKKVREIWTYFKESGINPRFMQSLNGWFTILWLFAIPISYFFGWLASVTYVSALSLWALVSGHLSAWQSARTEVLQAEAKALKDQEDIPGDVVTRLLQEFSIKPIQNFDEEHIDEFLGGFSKKYNFVMAYFTDFEKVYPINDANGDMELGSEIRIVTGGPDMNSEFGADMAQEIIESLRKV